MITLDPRYIPKNPLSDNYGFDRETPVNRRYIESFLAEHQADVHGSVLEIGDSRDSEAFDQGRVAALTVLDLDTSNRIATRIADLTATESLDRDSYYCILLASAPARRHPVDHGPGPLAA